MSEAGDKSRSDAKARVSRLLTDPQKPVDASNWREPGPELGMVQTGERPVTRARFRSGGAVHGSKTAMRADRKPRASGGMTANQYLNRNVRDANEERAGIKHDGGFKKGGRLARKSGGKTKGTNVNIIITQPKSAPPMPMGGMPPRPPQGIPAPPPQAMGVGAPAPMGPPAGAPPMGRKSGGRAYPIDTGAGGGRGRLEKIKAYG